MEHSKETSVSGPEGKATGQLVRFFPELRPVSTNVVLCLVQAGSESACDTICVEFSGPQKAIFGSALRLEFGDVIRLACQGGSLLKAKVIAVRYQDGRTAVAAQLLNGQFPWVDRP